jgi:UDPglucose 6-dehydrogenase
MNDVISVFGLGKLGCTMLACFAHKGWHVIGMDINENFVNKINNGDAPIYEPGVDALIKKNRDKIKATTDSKYAVDNSNISFVIVPTPSLKDGSFSTKYVEAVIAEIGSILRSKNDYHLIVITSTVLPGDMEYIVKLLEKTSSKKCNEHFGVCYNPDFIALGSIIKNFLNPDMILIGESDKKAGLTLTNIHNHLVDNKPNIHRMNFYNAELSKISLNAYCTLKITFANVLAEICEQMPGGDAGIVSNAIGDDVRIGRVYLKGGLSYGGPCFPRDNRAFAHSARKLGVTNYLASKTDEINDYHRNERIPNKIIEILREKNVKEIAILGLTYKKDTTLIEESASISIIKALSIKGIIVTVYDPAGLEEARDEFDNQNNINIAKSISSCINGKSVCFIATPWDEFTLLTSDYFLSKMKNPTILDSWGLFNFKNVEEIDYREIGKEGNLE